jgi:hypothetical protein
MSNDVLYKYEIPKVVTVQTDTREQCPMLFPGTIRIAHPEWSFKELVIGVKEEKVALPFGDYRLAEWPEQCVFERKGSQLEIFKNLTDSHDRIRQAKAFRKLSCGCRFPYLLIEASPAELLASSTRVRSPEVVCHRLATAMAKYGLQAMFVPWKSRSPDVRRKVGTLMLHIMVACGLKDVLDVPPILLEEPQEKNHEESEKGVDSDA